MRVSICIPTHEAGGHGHEYLNELLGTIKGQSYQDFEVIVSDHSKDNDIMTVCEAYSDAIEIRYVRNFYGRGRISPNINVALSLASGDITKIMFMDDFFYSNLALETIVHAMSDGTQWAACGYNHTKNTREYFRASTPKWAKYQLEGNNLIGNPSVITFRTEITEFFDDNVDLFMDTDFYQRLYSSYGLPKIIDKTIVSIREHDDRVSANTKYDGQFANEEDGTSWLINKEEIEYLWNKYGKPNER